MRGHEHACALVIACMALLAACGGNEARGEGNAAAAPPSRATATPQPAPPSAPDPSLPASKRILGKWRANLQQVSRAALKQTGISPKARVDYTITESEFILESEGAAGGHRVRWHYEIISESGDELRLRKVDGPDGPQEASVKVSGNRMLITRDGQASLPLERIE